jgi:hypothetical protein
MGLYVNAIFLETKRRPNYIVKDTFGFPPMGSPMTAAEVSPAMANRPRLPIPTGVAR